MMLSKLVVTMTICLLGPSLNCVAQEDLAKPTMTEEIINARDGSELTAELWQIETIENRKTNSGKVTLAVLRIKSPNPGGEPVFFLAGGPGGSGITAIRQMVSGGGNRFFDLIGGDIVAIDQRGVGLSTPNLSTDASYDFSSLLDATPTDRTARQLAVIKQEAEKFRNKGIDLSSYNTAESADDINNVRMALGYEKIVLWGSSYGTHLAMATIRKHESQIARALLVGPEGPDHTQKLPSDAEQVLNHISSLAAKDEHFKDLLPDMNLALAKILNELDITPKRVSVDGKEIVIYKSDIQGLIAMSIISIRGGADQVPLWVASMKDGDFSEVAKNLYEYQSSDGPQSMMSLAMDSMSGASQTRQTRIENESETCLLGGSMNANLPEIAQALGVTPLSDEFRSTLNTSVPIMFVVGSLDYRTPVTNARELADHMPNSHLVIIENCGHSDLPLGMPEVRDLWGKFLASGAGRSETFSGPEIHLAYHDENSAELPANAIELSLDQLEEFTGEYRFEQGDIVSVRAVEGHLILTFPDRREFSLWPQSESEFFADVKQIPTLTFSRDEAGNVSSFGGGGLTATKTENQNTKAIDLTVEQLEELVGFYDYGEWGQLKITRDGKELYAQLPGQQSMAISPTSSTELQWKRIPARLSLVRNEQGKIVSGTHHQNDKSLEVTKINQ